MPVKPITPSEITSAKAQAIPDAVLTGFNKVIAEYWDGWKSHFRLHAVIDAIVALDDPQVTRDALQDNSHWLDVEPIYREAGWVVEFDQPGYNESYPATFTFHRPRKS